MGVYINTDMPTRCGRCDMCVKEVDGDIDYHYECCITAARIDNLGEKMDDCPLVPVQPHGRLIDADAIADVFRGFIAMYDSCPFSQLSFPDKARRDELQSALAEVINAPTIIPAEEGET